jgi:hypothetical protein
MSQFIFPALDLTSAQSEAEFYRESGATAEFVSNADGTFTLTVTFPDEPAPVPAAAPPAIQPPIQPGLVLCINRLRSELRPSVGYARTVGVYQLFLNGAAIPGAQGYCVERQGPGDNTQTGVANHRRIAAGTYPLFTHGDDGRYRTIGYATPGALPNRPWPCLGVENTGARSGILIHCAAGYLMSIGCINLTSSVKDQSTNLDFSDSWNHVVQLINSISANAANFPAGNNIQIPNCILVITGEPDLQLAGNQAVAAGQANAAAAPGAPDDLNSELKTAILTGIRLNEIGNGSPYKLCFASKGSSGASFGVTQGDLAAGQPIVTTTFQNALAAAGFSAAEIQQFTSTLSVHLIGNPLSTMDTQRINAALLNSKNLVDSMDQQILAAVYSDVDKCISAASSAGRHVEPIAIIYMALWINMSGPPTSLLLWLKGLDPGMPGVPTLGPAVTEDDMKGYLSATSYFRANTGNLPHIVASAEAGALTLQQSAVA